MIVSWDWLSDYVTLDMPLETLTERLTMSGLNLEGIEQCDGDTGIDLEVTSNRPDCLGHVGVAREIAVLFNGKLTIPPAEPDASETKAAEAAAVDNECPDLCPQYFARVIRGVKVGPSPDWLRRRLETLGLASVNNVVDITNYVLMECGQPLHAFDFDKLNEGRIVVRRARRGEKIVAIDQREYELPPETCVIADAERPVAIGGVMGGWETEIGEETTNLLIETAEFAPLSVRNTARALNLHSPSSYRFERGVDPQGLDWASRRCCELILELAGGELLEGAVFAGERPEAERAPVELRFNQVPRILGIDVPADEAVQILTSLGVKPAGQPKSEKAEFIPPSWRRDLHREADLIEEVARIHGYDEIPEDVSIPVVPTARSLSDRIGGLVRDVFTAAGFYEAITLSFVSDEQHALFTPRGEADTVRVEHSSRRHENVLRQSLIPSLLTARRENERHGTFQARLFEMAKVYLAADPNRPETEVEPTMIGCVTGQPFRELKGVIERLAGTANHAAGVSVRPADVAQFAEGRGAEVLLNGRPWGWLGELDRSVCDKLDLRDAVTVAELDFEMLEAAANLAPTAVPLPAYPAVTRDLNFVLAEDVTWERLETTVREAAGELLESVAFGGEYRGEQIPAGRKSYLLTLSFRSVERTLTHEEVEQAQQAVVAACHEQLGTTLR